MSVAASVPVAHSTSTTATNRRMPTRKSSCLPSLASAANLTLADEWIGCEIEVAWSGTGVVGWAPIETVSLSEAGFERIYQGSAVLVSWPLTLAPGASWQGELRVIPRSIPRSG